MARHATSKLVWDELLPIEDQLQGVADAVEQELEGLSSVVNVNANSADWVDALPTASKALAGRVVVLSDGGAGGAGAEDDELYICVRTGGTWAWRQATLT